MALRRFRRIWSELAMVLLPLVSHLEKVTEK